MLEKTGFFNGTSTIFMYKILDRITSSLSSIKTQNNEAYIKSKQQNTVMILKGWVTFFIS